MPRIIAGKARRTQLKTLSGEATRPSLDRMKEALFSILQNRLLDAAFLDLYAGSGQIGLEALSRGARSAVFVEAAPRAVAVIRENIARCKLAEGAELCPIKVDHALTRFSREARRFDLIFMDPPWAEAKVDALNIAAKVAEILLPGGIWIVEHAVSEEFPEEISVFQRIRSCHYGAAMLSFYQVCQGESQD